MKTRGFILLFALAAFLVATVAAAVTTPELSTYLTPENITKIEAGETILFDQAYKDDQGKMRGKGLAIILVNKPKKDVWDVLVDYESYPKFMPRVETVILEFSEGDRYGLHMTLKVLLKKVQFHIIRDRNFEAGTIRYALDKKKKNDIEDIFGGWTIIPHGKGKCILAYTVAVDSGMFLPKSLQDYLTKKDLPELVRTVKLRVESGGTYTRK